MPYTEHVPEGGGTGYGGSKDPLVLLHAFPLHGGMWEPQLEALAESRRVILPDYPGFGRAASEPVPAVPEMGYYAEALRELLDRLGLERVVLGGISMGGYVAFAALRGFPERISGLILADTNAAPDTEEARRGRNETAALIAESGVGILPGLLTERLLSEHTRRESPQTVERVQQMMLDSSPDGVVAALGALRERPDSTPLLGEIRVPTLVVGGEEDALSPPETMAGMADAIPDSRHVVLSEAGHLSNLESPGKFSAALSGFLEET
ncbi:alpha/beta fold hydrolase [Rubrobacter aplysinae]|uniref:alpha/beta fold hydrolase n=1 Tax=Rubrobacter aplysinae TaxID=909625 RepID=UPI00064B8685|nr:alpha/beta fold hydrolase [Rubrobacter aplysinae]